MTPNVTPNIFAQRANPQPVAPIAPRYGGLPSPAQPAPPVAGNPYQPSNLPGAIAGAFGPLMGNPSVGPAPVMPYRPPSPVGPVSAVPRFNPQPITAQNGIQNALRARLGIQ
jgi:hypothetical protein